MANLGENEVNEPESNRHYLAVKALAEQEGSQVLPICAKLEADIAELDDPEEKAMFMEELGVKESGLDRLIKSSYALLGLISFLTAGSDECRAWTIKNGTKAPQAAGKIHTDFERGFIRAEVIAFEDMKACGTMANAKAKGAKIGRPTLTADDIPPIFLRHYPAYRSKQLNLSELARVCDLSRTTAYKYIDLLEGRTA